MPQQVCYQTIRTRTVLKRKYRENLRKSGVKDEQIHFTGNVMTDTLLANRHKFTRPEIWERAGVEGAGLLTTLLCCMLACCSK